MRASLLLWPVQGLPLNVLRLLGLLRMRTAWSYCFVAAVLVDA